MIIILECHSFIIILGHTDNLSKTLQLTKLSAEEGQYLAKKTVTTLQEGHSYVYCSACNNDYCVCSPYDLMIHTSCFWQDVVQAEKLDIQDPILPRRRKVPCRYEIGSTRITDSIITPENHYSIIYFEASDIKSSNN